MKTAKIILLHRNLLGFYFVTSSREGLERPDEDKKIPVMKLARAL